MADVVAVGVAPAAAPDASAPASAAAPKKKGFTLRLRGRSASPDRSGAVAAADDASPTRGRTFFKSFAGRRTKSGSPAKRSSPKKAGFLSRTFRFGAAVEVLKESDQVVVVQAWDGTEHGVDVLKPCKVHVLRAKVVHMVKRADGVDDAAADPKAPPQRYVLLFRGATLEDGDAVPDAAFKPAEAEDTAAFTAGDDVFFGKRSDVRKFFGSRKAGGSVAGDASTLGSAGGDATRAATSTKIGKGAPTSGEDPSLQERLDALLQPVGAGLRGQQTETIRAVELVLGDVFAKDKFRDEYLEAMIEANSGNSVPSAVTAVKRRATALDGVGVSIRLKRPEDRAMAVHKLATKLYENAFSPTYPELQDFLFRLLGRDAVVERNGQAVRDRSELERATGR
ncbi:hypothetical protein SO694_0010207 [Aureococcus anophagefferens]|uniref:Uncharacterized protein n=1 Tax=Aureococcus anophagefferens TaxID=44056 RepID=A0ABR1FND6_AURAN